MPGTEFRIDNVTYGSGPAERGRVLAPLRAAISIKDFKQRATSVRESLGFFFAGAARWARVCVCRCVYFE